MYACRFEVNEWKIMSLPPKLIKIYIMCTNKHTEVYVCTFKQVYRGSKEKDFSSMQTMSALELLSVEFNACTQKADDNFDR